jgi:hypothetical protein
MNINKRLGRRDLLCMGGGILLGSGVLSLEARLAGQEKANANRSATDRREAAAKKHLESVMPDREKVLRFITPTRPGEYSANGGFAFDAELGWKAERSFRDNGVDGSTWFADYEPGGARSCINYASAPCRIHSYGDSFTHGSQVNDGETWQEYLAAHIREPIRNYGVGGYSVYQAYRRMRLIEPKSPAEYIILNIYDDDHYRNLENWRAIRWGGGGTVGFTLPHVVVDVGRNEFREVDNLCRNAEDVYRLCDRNFVWEKFRDDPTLAYVLSTQNRNQEKIPEVLVEPPETIFGLPVGQVAADKAAERLAKLHTEAALYASKRTVELIERFVAEHRKKLLVILSFGRTNLRKVLGGEERFDREFLNWIRTRGYPVADMLEPFVREFSLLQTKLPVEDFIRRYYIGHHTPAGNHFTAMEIKDAVVRWLNPKPTSYPAGKG